MGYENGFLIVTKGIKKLHFFNSVPSPAFIKKSYFCHAKK
jgi:hypothetical protein